MADIHIDDFYHDVAKIFLRLYAVFPVKTILYVEDISGPDEPDEFGLHHPRYQACFSATVWLAEQGYLSFDDTVRQDALDQAVLTRRAFLLLSSSSELDFSRPQDASELPPSVLEEAQTNIAQLRAALAQQSSLALKQCVTYLLSQPTIGAP